MTATGLLAWSFALDDAQLETVLLGLFQDTVWWLGILGAVAAGFLHALGPGHGKTLVGAYLAGTRGRPVDAVALGGLVAIMHTGSVLVVGLLFFATQQLPTGQQLEGWLRLASAVAIITVGVVLLRRALRHRGGATVAAGVGYAADREHRHLDTIGDRADPHDHALPDGVPPLSRAGIAAIATSGGLLPSPAAFLVLATAIAVGRTTYGLVLVGAFGVGLALTLTAIGLAVLWGRDWLAKRGEGRLHRAVAWLPFGAGVAVIAGGLWLGVVAVRLL